MTIPPDELELLPPSVVDAPEEPELQSIKPGSQAPDGQYCAHTNWN